MIWEKLKKEIAAEIALNWKKSSTPKEAINASKNSDVYLLSEDYLNLRCELDAAYKELKQKAAVLQRKDTYFIDLEYGLMVYDILCCKYKMTIREASDDDIWRYISMIVIPDIVFDRWQEINDERFWQTKRRIWIKLLWWFIFLSWQGDISSTRDILTESFDISQLVERSGRHGYRVSLYRKIMYYHGKQQRNIERLLSKVLQLNIVRSQVLEPCLFDGGEKAYVIELFNYFGVTFTEVT